MRERYTQIRDDLNRKIGVRDTITQRVEDNEEKAAVLDAECVVLTQAIEVIQTATETRRQELRDRVDNLVTRGLRAVFRKQDYEFRFDVTLARQQFGVVPILKTKFGKRYVETSIRDGHGGGIADVISFLLRLIVLTLARPRVAPVMVLDESFKHVSPEFLRGVAVLLKELNQAAGVQFIMVTHKEALLDAADVIYSVRLDANEETQFKLEHDLRDDVYHRKPRRGEKTVDRTTLFDHEDLGKTEKGTAVWGETKDAIALRNRGKKKRRTRLKK